jgi:TRAP-type uncharacterized transport system substrate-binding protein
MDIRKSQTGRLMCGALATLGLWIGANSAIAAESLVERANRGLVEVVTGSVNGTSVRMAEDLADALDDGATRRVLPVVGKGAFQNLADLKILRGVDLAIVQTDVLDYARDQKLYANLNSSVTYIAKLNNDEFHLLARGDIKTVADLAGKKVNFGPPNDGANFTGPRLFASVNVKVEATSYSQALALEKLKAGEIAAMAVVAGKPVALFQTLRAQDKLHFLRVPLKGDMTQYVPARLDPEDYPDLVAQGSSVETVAVGTALIVAGLAPDSQRYRNVANFVDVFFTQFPKLLDSSHHPKWQEVNLAAELPHWQRFAPADSWIKRNGVNAPVAFNETEMRDIFTKFLDERSKANGAQTLTAEQKEQLFDQFKRWQGDHSH